MTASFAFYFSTGTSWRQNVFFALSRCNKYLHHAKGPGKFPGPLAFCAQQGWTLPLPTTFGLLYLFIFTSIIRC